MVQDKEREEQATQLHTSFSIGDIGIDRPPWETAEPSSAESNSLANIIGKLDPSTASQSQSPSILWPRDDHLLAKSPLRELVLCSQRSEHRLVSSTPLLTPDASSIVLQNCRKSLCLSETSGLVRVSSASSSAKLSSSSRLIMEGSRILSELSSRHVAEETAARDSRCTSLFLQDMGHWLEGQETSRESQSGPILDTTAASLLSVPTPFLSSSIDSVYMSPLFSTGASQAACVGESMGYSKKLHGSSPLLSRGSQDDIFVGIESIIKPSSSLPTIRVTRKRFPSPNEICAERETSERGTKPRLSESLSRLPYLTTGSPSQKKHPTTVFHRPTLIRSDAASALPIIPSWRRRIGRVRNRESELTVVATSKSNRRLSLG
ncbi:hypothetical protein FRB94_005842 [Tulasnella sp. JGI-2019a]|nr:hypothetical protein FRB94_005842 [Tulasnella sp. JGI-2019a]